MGADFDKVELRRLAVKRFIREHVVAEAWPPQVRMVAEGVGLSLSYTHDLIRELVERGHLREPKPGVYTLTRNEWRQIMGGDVW
jgi:predicted transcriptional regulator